MMICAFIPKKHTGFEGRGMSVGISTIALMETGPMLNSLAQKKSEIVLSWSMFFLCEQWCMESSVDGITGARGH